MTWEIAFPVKNELGEGRSLIRLQAVCSGAILSATQCWQATHKLG